PTPCSHLFPYTTLFRSDRGRYMLDEVLADTGSGHNVVATVFIDCRFQYRTDGPAELRSIGEVEAVADLAEQCEADHPGKTRVARSEEHTSELQSRGHPV